MENWNDLKIALERKWEKLAEPRLRLIPFKDMEKVIQDKYPEEVSCLENLRKILSREKLTTLMEEDKAKRSANPLNGGEMNVIRDICRALKE